jgi:histidinol phosphatase-like enzyme
MRSPHAAPRRRTAGRDLHAPIRLPLTPPAAPPLPTKTSQGLRKPDPAAFRAALAHLGRAPAEVLLVDDRAVNVEAARALGMDGIVFAGAGPLAEALAARGLVL